MIEKEVLDRLFRLKLTSSDKSNLYSLLYSKLGKHKELGDINNKLNSKFSDLLREYLGEEYMNQFRKVKRISKIGNTLKIQLDKTDKIPKILPDPEDKVKIDWYENYKSIVEEIKCSILTTKSPLINIVLDEYFPNEIITKDGLIELKKEYNSFIVSDIEVLNKNESTNKIINEIYYLYLEYFKYFFIDRNFLRNTIYGSCSSYNFLQDIVTWKGLYRINREWLEMLYDYYTLGSGSEYGNDVRFKYIESNSKDKIEELIEYIIE